MRRLIPALFLLLAACQTGGKPNAAAETAPITGAIAGPEVATTALEAPKAGAKPAVKLPDPVAGGMVDASMETGTAALPVEKTKGKPVAEQVAKPVAETPVEDAPLSPVPETAEQDDSLDDAVAVEEAAPELPPALKSAAQKKCERGGGSYVAVGGNKDFRTCVKRTRDANKSCDEDSDCQGKCLARSRTCAPIDPLLGCNDILNDYGLVLRECVQ
jgi:hypothetical protein